MKKKKIKARRIDAKPEPHYVLPDDAASVEAMVDQMAESMCVPRYRIHDENVKEFYRNKARAALAAIGISNAHQPVKRKRPNSKPCSKTRSANL